MTQHRERMLWDGAFLSSTANNKGDTSIITAQNMSYQRLVYNSVKANCIFGEKLPRIRGIHLL